MKEIASSEISPESLDRTIEEIKSGAQNGVAGERYVTLVRTEDLRVSIAARRYSGKITYTVEVQFRLLSEEQGKEVKYLRRSTEATSDLLSRGFAPGRQEDAWVTCEKKVKEEDLRPEIVQLVYGREVRK